MVAELLFVFAVSLFALVKSSDFFVEYAARLARRLGVSPVAIGLTVVAVGTSLPELAASVTASLEGGGALALGNVVGSNAANIGLILGVTAAFYTLRIPRLVLFRDLAVMLFATLLLGVFLEDGVLSRLEGAFLLLFFAGYLLFLMRRRPKWADQREFSRFLFYFFGLRFVSDASAYALRLAAPARRPVIQRRLALDAAAVLAALLAVQVSAHFAMAFALRLAHALGVSEALVGLSLVSVGTSLPEFSVALSSARKGLYDIVVGNVVGSNIANVFLVAGAAAVAAPLQAAPSVTGAAYPGMLALSLMLVAVRWKTPRIAREAGLFFFLVYGALLALSFLCCSAQPAP